MTGAVSIKQYTPSYFKIVQLRRHIYRSLPGHIQAPQASGLGTNPPALLSDQQSDSHSDSLSDTPAEVTPLTPRRKPRTSYARARSAVFEYALCNDWQYFCTLTPRGKDTNFYNLNVFMRKVAQWVRDMRKRPGWENIKYILVPEKFESGGWHLHGFFMGIPEGHCQPFDLESASSKKQRRKLQALNEKGLLSFPAYSSKFGYATMSVIKDSSRCATYICKYITKAVEKTITKGGAALYYPCRGLKRAERVFYGECRNRRACYDMREDQNGCLNNPTNEALFDWVDYNKTFTHHNDYVSLGVCAGFEVVEEKNVMRLKVYTDEGEKPVTMFDVVDLVEYCENMIFSDDDAGGIFSCEKSISAASSVFM